MADKAIWAPIHIASHHFLAGTLLWAAFNHSRNTVGF